VTGEARFMQIAPHHHPLLLNLAREAIHAAFSDAPLGPPPDEPLLQSPAGCFVSLHTLRAHRLRGCVGRLDAELSLGSVIRAMSQAVLNEPRFRNDPITPAEFGELEIELSLISPLVRIHTPAEFDPLSEGIYLTCLNRSGCFLPQVARDTGWSKEELLSRLCEEKLGLAPSVWRSADCQFEIFTTTLIGPAPFLPSGDSQRAPPS